MDTNKHLLTFLLFFLPVLSFADNTYDMIITTDKEQIQCMVKEISENTVSFIRADKPVAVTYTLPKDKIVLVQFTDGTTEVFSVEQPADKQQQTQTAQLPSISSQQQNNTNTPKDYAIVDSYGGVYVFNDCTPVDQYEVLGDVSFGGKTSGSSFVALPNGMGGTTMIVSGGETAQYTSIRNGLVANAVMANRAVEGIIISIPKEGMGRATMIKFKEKSDNNRLAKVNNHRGLYVFSDCKPVNTYTSIKKVKGKLVYWSSAYYYIRDTLLTKAARTKNCNAVIINLVEGGRDYVETINL